MFEWLTPIEDFFKQFTWWEQLAFAAGLFLVMFFGSIAAVSLILVKLPATYFADHHPAAFAEHHPVLRWLLIILKNLLGVLLVLIGIILSLPGVPGQGFLTILIGLMLIDFPGKRTLERKLISRPSVLNAVNSLRERFGKPPMVLEESGSDSAGGASAKPPSGDADALMQSGQSKG